VCPRSRILINPYTYQSNAYESFCIEVLRVGSNDLYSRFMNDHFHKPWKNEPRTTLTLSQKVLDSLKETTLSDIFEDRIRDIVPQDASMLKVVPNRQDTA
jgi:hypothetical protein